MKIMKEKPLTKNYLIFFLLLAAVCLCMPQTASAAGRPGKITNLKCGVITASSINISWQPKSGISKYQVFRSTSYDGPFQLIKEIAPGNHAFCNMNLKKGREYYYRVRACSGSKTGVFSKVLTARTKCASRSASVRVSSNVRKHAGTEHPVLATLSPGTKVTVVCSTNNSSGAAWSRISFKLNGKKKSGYIRSDLLSSKGTAKPSRQAGIVTANSGLRLRKSANPRSGIITSLPKGTVVTILKQSTGTDGQKWYQVSVKRAGRTFKGYVFAAYVRVS